eukprot:NODE_3455_length_927_cov_8.684510_g2878_i0.p2 GENE.NODE_3455_length_927_cov_8.684510_g2878_i0~~NODE_3455_length_927_cov_8.684510_g2878_i0.p2  ORF type:complete len:61 (+),score=3.80 NODE_3455_length_927_cov_8.684510_g2878_i0:722-904(+)
MAQNPAENQLADFQPPRSDLSDQIWATPTQTQAFRPGGRLRVHAPARRPQVGREGPLGPR